MTEGEVRRSRRKEEARERGEADAERGAAEDARVREALERASTLLGGRPQEAAVTTATEEGPQEPPSGDAPQPAPAPPGQDEPLTVGAPSQDDDNDSDAEAAVAFAERLGSHNSGPVDAGVALLSRLAASPGTRLSREGCTGVLDLGRALVLCDPQLLTQPPPGVVLFLAELALDGGARLADQQAREAAAAAAAAASAVGAPPPPRSRPASKPAPAPAQPLNGPPRLSPAECFARERQRLKLLHEAERYAALLLPLEGDAFGDAPHGVARYHWLMARLAAGRDETASVAPGEGFHAGHPGGVGAFRSVIGSPGCTRGGRGQPA